MIGRKHEGKKIKIYNWQKKLKLNKSIVQQIGIEGEERRNDAM